MMKLDEWLDDLESIQSLKEEELPDLTNALITFFTKVATQDMKEQLWEMWKTKPKKLLRYCREYAKEGGAMALARNCLPWKYQEHFLRFYFSRPSQLDLRYWYDPDQDRGFLAVGESLKAADGRAAISAILSQMDSMEEDQEDETQIQAWRWNTTAEIYGIELPDIEDVWMRTEELAQDIAKIVPDYREIPARVKEIVAEALDPFRRAKETRPERKLPTTYIYELVRGGEQLAVVSIEENSSDLAGSLFYGSSDFDLGPPQEGDQINCIGEEPIPPSEWNREEWSQAIQDRINELAEDLGLSEDERQKIEKNPEKELMELWNQMRGTEENISPVCPDCDMEMVHTGVGPGCLHWSCDGCGAENWPDGLEHDDDCPICVPPEKVAEKCPNCHTTVVLEPDEDRRCPECNPSVMDLADLMDTIDLRTIRGDNQGGGRD